MHILIAVLLLVLAIFGVAGMMDSYATAKQAQATIEVAQVAQVNAWGNLIVILLLALIILCVAGVIVWMVVRRADSRRQTADGRLLQADPHPSLLRVRERGQMPSLETLIQLKTLDVLERMSPPVAKATSPKIADRDLGGQDEDELGWLR